MGRPVVHDLEDGGGVDGMQSELGKRSIRALSKLSGRGLREHTFRRRQSRQDNFSARTWVGVNAPRFFKVGCHSERLLGGIHAEGNIAGGTLTGKWRTGGAAEGL